MRHFFLFTSLFVFLATASKAQEKESRHTIRGQIIDATTGEPLPYATISGLGRIRFTLQSNVDGYFSLMQVRSTDTLELNVSYLGYKTRAVSLNATLENNYLVIKLAPVDFNLSASRFKQNFTVELEFSSKNLLKASTCM